MTAPRKICVVTGTRADYGLLYWLIREIDDDRELDLQLVVTGMHLSPAFGHTVDVIKADGFSIAAEVEMLEENDSPAAMARSVGRGVMGLADALDRLFPDVVVVLGDRFEILAAAEAALLLGLPIAHIHGGEASEGAVDESIRHAITKMASLHFVAAEPYRRRVIQMGEHPDRVFFTGAPGLDHLTRSTLKSVADLESELDFTLGSDFFVVTCHPETRGETAPEALAETVLEGLAAFPDHKVLVTASNADAGGRMVNRIMEDYAKTHADRVLFVPSLGQAGYLGALRAAAAVVGNSSSGLIEAPAAGVPTVNVGTRQQGRLRAASVIDCPANDASAVVHAIERALSDEFRGAAFAGPPPYGAPGQVCRTIKDHLKAASLMGLTTQAFYDLDDDEGGGA